MWEQWQSMLRLHNILVGSLNEIMESKENVWSTILSEGEENKKCTHDLDYEGKKKKILRLYTGKRKRLYERLSLGDMIKSRFFLLFFAVFHIKYASLFYHTTATWN